MPENIEIKQVSEKEIWVGKNRFYLDENNIFHMIIIGDVDKKLASTMIEVTDNLGNVFEEKTLVLIDLNKVKNTSSKARKVGMEEFGNKKIAKIALFGMHPVARVIASFVMGVSKNKSMRFFKTKKEALSWLKNEPPISQKKNTANG